MYAIRFGIPIAIGLITLLIYGIKALVEKKQEARSHDNYIHKKINSVTNMYFPNYTGAHNGHRYVELGLPSRTLWAVCNLGAANPGQFGSYFEWGSPNPGVKQYNNKTCFMPMLDAQHDAASVNWGGSWRIPTKEAYAELAKFCTWEIAKCDQIIGYKVTGPNGNSLFLPFAGEIWDGKVTNGTYTKGYYWTCQQGEQEPKSAYYVRFFDDGIKEVEAVRKDLGCSIRPVISANSPR